MGLALVTLIVRWIFSGVRQLVPDEAYYWFWSRHPSLSYVDHPPMIAWVIRLGTRLGGDNELAVRWPMAIMAVGMVLILWRVFLRLNADFRAAGFVAVSLLVSPLVGILGSIATPDTPAMFFQAAALGCVLLIFAPGERRVRLLWMGFGLFMGLALDSKYTSVLLGGSVLLALVCGREGRGQLRTRWPWIAAVIAAVVFSPVIIWNARHHWLSFTFQLQHGMSRDDSTSLMSNVVDYVGSQLGIATPVICVMSVMVLGIYGWRMVRGRASMYEKLLVATGAVPLIFFAATLLHKRGNGNWPIFAYLPATMLIGQYLSENWKGRRAWWARTGAVVALAILIVIHLPEFFMTISPKLGNPQWDRLYGWRELAGEVQQYRRGSPVYATDYEYASELTFYLPDHPTVWPLADDLLGVHRPTVFDQVLGYTPPSAHQRVLLVRKLHDYGDNGDLLLANQGRFTHLDKIRWPTVEYGRTMRVNLITIGTK
jgi:4-amino-4-deoxy-L-arabinose transferase-like glycosyltransferase